MLANFTTTAFCGIVSRRSSKLSLMAIQMSLNQDMSRPLKIENVMGQAKWLKSELDLVLICRNNLPVRRRCQC